MSNEPDTTKWSLPEPVDAPRDDLKLQLEVYRETILLRGFDGDTNWVRTVSADEIANVFTRHLGFSSGLLPDDALWWNQGETGQMVALWRPPQVWPVALQWEAFKPPARLRLPMPGLVFVCSLGRAPWVYAAMGRPTDPEQQLYRAPAFNVFRRRAGLPRKPPVPRGGGPDTGRTSSSPSSPLPETPTEPLEEAPRTTCIALMGGDRWEEQNTRWRTLFSSVRWPTPWRSPRGDLANGYR